MLSSLVQGLQLLHKYVGDSEVECSVDTDSTEYTDGWIRVSLASGILQPRHEDRLRELNWIIVVEDTEICCMYNIIGVGA